MDFKDVLEAIEEVVAIPEIRERLGYKSREEASASIKLAILYKIALESNEVMDVISKHVHHYMKMNEMTGGEGND